MKFIVVKRSLIVTIILSIIAGFGGWYVVNKGIVPTTGKAQEDELVFHMITAEFKATMEDGTEVEAYRFDPGTITVPKGKDITISIFGVNGHEHPFTIEGTDVAGVIKKGEETLIKTRFDKAGVYQLICSSHSHENGHHAPPMIAYIYVY